MKSMDELVKEIVETDKLASIDLETIPWRSRTSMTNTVRDAQERLVGLKKTYFDRVNEATVGIFVMGPNAEAWSKIAEDEGGTITVRADALYLRIADTIEPVVADRREFNVTAMAKLMSVLTDIGLEFRIGAMNVPKFHGMRVPDRQALVAHVRNIIREALGDDLSRMYLTREIQSKAYERRFKATVFPIVVIGLESVEEIEGLEPAVAKFGAKVVTDDETPITKESVLEVFENIKKRLFKKKNKQPEQQTAPQNTPDTSQNTTPENKQ